MSDVTLLTTTSEPVYADLETANPLDLELTPRMDVVVPFTSFTENSGSFVLTGGGVFTMPNDGTYQIRLSCDAYNSSTDEREDPAQLIAFMAYSGISIANTVTFFKLQQGETKTCVVSANIVGYVAGTEIGASLEAGDKTSLTLSKADLSVRLIY
jgi:hypothetical protein